jgi:hypothetical protein
MPILGSGSSLTRIARSSLAINLVCLPLTVEAQPTDYIDLGVRTTGDAFAVPVRLAHPTAVQWYRIELPATDAGTSPQGFVDISAMPTFRGDFMRYGLHAIYDSQGNLFRVGRNVSDGPVFQMSFGNHDPRPPLPVPPVEYPEIPNPPFSGQDGAISSGVYWVVIANHPTYFQTDWGAAGGGNPNINDVESMLYFNLQPGGVPYCDPDFNWDGNIDQEDAWYLINVIAGGENTTGRWADYNRDGNEDQDDVLALIHTIAGGGCP